MFVVLVHHGLHDLRSEHDANLAGPVMAALSHFCQALLLHHGCCRLRLS
jgi:hypothetical protein